VKEVVSSHVPDEREGNLEDSKDAKTSSVGVRETLKDASERLTEKFTSSKKEPENFNSYKDKMREMFDYTKEREKKSGEDLSRGAFTKESYEHMAGDIFRSSKGKISDDRAKIKEEGEQALKTTGETYDSFKESIERVGDYVQRTIEDANERLRVKEHEEEQLAGLKSNVREADTLYKFRQVVDKVYLLSPELWEATGKLEKQVLGFPQVGSSYVMLGQALALGFVSSTLVINIWYCVLVRELGDWARPNIFFFVYIVAFFVYIIAFFLCYCIFFYFCLQLM